MFGSALIALAAASVPASAGPAAPSVPAGAVPAAAASFPAGAVPAGYDPNVCDNRPVLMIVAGRIEDRARIQAYGRAIRDSGLYTRLGAYYINLPRTLAVFEGQPATGDSTLIVRFPCLAHARTFWYSTQYQREIVPLRTNPSAGSFTVTVVPEAPVPDALAGTVSAGGYARPFGPDAASAIPQVPDKPAR